MIVIEMTCRLEKGGSLQVTAWLGGRGCCMRWLAATGNCRSTASLLAVSLSCHAEAPSLFNTGFLEKCCGVPCFLSVSPPLSRNSQKCAAHVHGIFLVSLGLQEDASNRQLPMQTAMNTAMRKGAARKLIVWSLSVSTSSNTRATSNFPG